MPWDPARYQRFRKEREAPFEDLARLVRPRTRMRVLDLGCGTGALTARLHARLPGARTTGLDSSPEMLAGCAAHAAPGLDFEQGRIEDAQGRYDLVFSHAALQWVGDHETALPRWVALLAPGGQLAVQMPANHDRPSHVLAREVAAEPRFRRALGGWVRAAPVLEPARYAELLHAAGCKDLVVFEKVYPHELAGPDALVDWVRGTLLVPYMERLGPGDGEAFLARYRERVAARFPAGPFLFAFPRILFSARRPGKKK